MAIVKLLLDNGAKVNQPMYDGDTPMHMAHYKGHQEAIKLLLQHESNINAQNTEGKTPLHCLLHSKDVNLETKFTIIKSFHDKYDMTIQDKDDSIVIGMLFMLASNPFATEVNVDNSDTDVHVSTLGNNDDL